MIRNERNSEENEELEQGFFGGHEIQKRWCI
jgi:hypothetical protein